MQTTFSPADFRETFRPVLMKWTRNYGIFVGAVILFIFSLHHIIPYAVSAWGVNVLRIINYGVSVVDGIAVGSVSAMGLVTIGGVNAMGLVAVGGVNTFGIVAIGCCNTVGIVSIGTSAIGIYALGGNAIGVVAMGWRAQGVYAFSYSAKGRGRYLFAPYRQDPEAVAFFMR